MRTSSLLKNWNHDGVSLSSEPTKVLFLSIKPNLKQWQNINCLFIALTQISELTQGPKQVNPNRALACARACSIKLLKYIISHQTQGLIKLKICIHAHIDSESEQFKKYYLYDVYLYTHACRNKSMYIKTCKKIYITTLSYSQIYNTHVFICGCSLNSYTIHKWIYRYKQTTNSSF